MRRTRQTSKRREDGYKSGLEAAIAKQIEAVTGCDAAYETLKLPYVQTHIYTPDFLLPNGIILEGKGYFDSEDRTKHLLVSEQHPQYDIRFVFSNARSPIRSGSQTTCGDWCQKYGYDFAEKIVPVHWFLEQKPQFKAKPSTCYQDH